MNKRILPSSLALVAILGIGLFGLVGCGSGPGEEGNPVPEDETELYQPPATPDLTSTDEPPAGTGGSTGG